MDALSIRPSNRSMNAWGGTDRILRGKREEVCAWGDDGVWLKKKARAQRESVPAPGGGRREQQRAKLSWMAGWKRSLWNRNTHIQSTVDSMIVMCCAQEAAGSAWLACLECESTRYFCSVSYRSCRSSSLTISSTHDECTNVCVKVMQAPRTRTTPFPKSIDRPTNHPSI